MNRYLEAVKEFHNRFQVPVCKLNEEIPLEVRQLRVKLIFEELKEFAQATDCMGTFENLCRKNVTPERLLPPEDGNNRNKKEEIDALLDITYVTMGSSISLGYHEVFDEAFEEVQRSNMSKACDTMEEAIDTVSYYKKKDGTEGYYTEVDGKYLVYRKGDEKVLKSINYSAANLSKIID